MLLTRILFQLLLLQTIEVCARPQSFHFSRSQHREIQWGPCNLTTNESLPMVCGTLPVPLDYTQPNSSETLTLELAKVAATKKPSKGTILFNFGGPGEPNRESMAALAAQLQATEGGYHDLVTFDTRGTENTLPFSCYKSEDERLLSTLAYPQVLGKSSDVARGMNWVNTKAIAETCKANGEDIGGLLGTAFVARDMMQIVDVLTDDGLLKYWGISYGATLGATAAAMFPNRMDRVILEAVYNPHEYFNSLPLEQFKDTDKTFSHFLSECVKAGERCALAGLNATAEELEETMYEFLEKLKYNPILFNGTTVVDYTKVKASALNFLYGPKNYPILATTLHGLLTGNETEFGPLFAPASISPSGDAVPGIECADKTVRASRMEDTFPGLDEMERISRFGGDIKTGIVMQCSQWPFESKERYLGDFNVKTRHPVLAIGATWDPVTPFVSAQNITASFEGSVALEHRGAGHGSAGQASVCTQKAVQAYFLNGTMPDPGTVCEVDVPLFSDVTWRDVLL